MCAVTAARWSRVEGCRGRGREPRKQDGRLQKGTSSPVRHETRVWQPDSSSSSSPHAQSAPVRTAPAAHGIPERAQTNPTTYKFEKLDIRSSRPYISRREWFVAVHSHPLHPFLVTRLLSQHAFARRYCCRPSSRSPHKEERKDREHGDLLGTSAAVAAGAQSRFLMQTNPTTSFTALDARASRELTRLRELTRFRSVCLSRVLCVARPGSFVHGRGARERRQADGHERAQAVREP